MKKNYLASLFCLSLFVSCFSLNAGQARISIYRPKALHSCLKANPELLDRAAVHLEKGEMLFDFREVLRPNFIVKKITNHQYIRDTQRNFLKAIVSNQCPHHQIVIEDIDQDKKVASFTKNEGFEVIKRIGSIEFNSNDEKRVKNLISNSNKLGVAHNLLLMSAGLPGTVMILVGVLALITALLTFNPSLIILAGGLNLLTFIPGSILYHGGLEVVERNMDKLHERKNIKDVMNQLNYVKDNNGHIYILTSDGANEKSIDLTLKNAIRLIERKK